MLRSVAFTSSPGAKDLGFVELSVRQAARSGRRRRRTATLTWVSCPEACTTRKSGGNAPCRARWPLRSRRRVPVIEFDALVIAGAEHPDMIYAAALLLVASASLQPPRVLSAPPDAIEGKWFGTAGLPGDRAGYGFEFRRGEDGVLRAHYYSPPMNFYGLDAGEARAVADGYEVAALGLHLKLDGDALAGTFSALKVPVDLKRVDALPAEPTMPDIPRGPGPRLAIELGAPIWAGVAARDGVAYVGTSGGVMNAVALEDGAFVWTLAAGRPIHGEALVTDDAVYFACDDGRLRRIDRKDGREIWRHELGDAQVARVLPHPEVYEYDWSAPRPLLVDGVVYVGAGDGSFHAVEAGSGKLLWRAASGDRVRTTAIVSGPHVIFGSFDGGVRALDRATGELVWKKDLLAPATTAPALVGDRLVVGTRSSVLYGLKPTDGAVEWRALFWGSWVESQAVALDDRLCIGSSDLRSVSCYDPRDGSLSWRTDVYGCPWARPVVTATTIFASVVGAEPYMIRHEGSLCALDRASGRIRWRWRVPDAPGSFLTGFVGAPAIDGKSLAVGGLDGALYVFPIE